MFIFSCNFKENATEKTNIPGNLEEAINQLNKIFDDSTKAEIKKKTEDQFSSESHFGIGKWIRNNWQLWNDDSKLSKYFHHLGIYHPDDMSGIILDSYHRSLLGKDIQLNEQIKYYQEYWLVVTKPDQSRYPTDEVNLEFGKSLYYIFEDNKQGCIHVQTNSSNDSLWIYDYYFGWKKIDSVTLKNLTDNQKQRAENLKKLFSK